MACGTALEEWSRIDWEPLFTVTRLMIVGADTNDYGSVIYHLGEYATELLLAVY